MVMSITYCTNCNTPEPKTRPMTSGEVELVGYEPEDARVCCSCESIYDVLIEIPEDDPRRDR